MPDSATVKIPRLDLAPGSLWLIQRDALEALRSRQVLMPSDAALGAVSRGLRSLVEAESDDLESDAPDPFDFRASFRLDVQNGVAVIPIQGPLSDQCTPIDLYFNWMLGGDCYQVIEAKIQSALSRSDVKAIVYRMDTPGGTVAGCARTASCIRQAAKMKPSCTFVSGWSCSAGYWLACATSEIVAGPGSEIGSIGMYTVVYDDTKMLEMIGIEEILIVSEQSPEKVPDPKTDEGKALYQARANAVAAQFISEVASGRGVSAQVVMKDFGKGNYFFAADALKVGMIDRLGSFDDVVKKMSGANRNRLARSSATQAAAVAKAITPTSRSRPMSLRSKLLAVFSGASAADDANALTEAEKLQALDAIGAAEETTTFTVLQTSDDGKSATIRADAAAAAALKPFNIEESPEFKAQAAKIAAMEKQLADNAAAKAKDEADKLAREAEDFSLSLVKDSRIPAADAPKAASLFAKLSACDSAAETEPGAGLLADFKAFCATIPAAGERYAASLNGKHVFTLDSVETGGETQTPNPANVKRLMALAGLPDNS